MSSSLIDRQTVEKIKDACNIVDVVSEFVTLHKSGANYKGLCPFHNERTPSFFVSPARGTCHCFGCGKGGNSVTFIMEHEQMTYPEALRWLADKYHIEIQEREMTDEERKQQSERESMFIVNEWAAKYFESQLQNKAKARPMVWLTSAAVGSATTSSPSSVWATTRKTALRSPVVPKAKAIRQTFSSRQASATRPTVATSSTATPAEWSSPG